MGARQKRPIRRCRHNAKVSNEYSYVLIRDQVIPDGWFPDTEAGHDEAHRTANYNNSHYQGYWEVRRMLDSDTIPAVVELTTNIDAARAVRHLVR